MSAATDSGDLELRFTEQDRPDEPPDLAAFRGVNHELLREQLAGHDDLGPLGDLTGAGRFADRTVVHAPVPDPVTPIFVLERGAPIPAIDLSSGPSTEPDAFALGAPLRGHLVWLPRADRPRPSSRAAALVLSLSLALPTAAAAAPAPAPPSLPADPAAPPDVAAAPPTTAPAVPPPNPNVSTEIPPLDRILNMLRGQEAIVYVGGRPITGRILSVDGDILAMIDNDRDGRIALIPRAQIQDVRGKTPPPRPEALPDGRSPIAGGAVLVGLGAPLMLSALVFVGITPSSTSVWLPQFLPAAALLGAGIPLLVRGVRQRRAYRQALAERMARLELAPTFAPTRHGGWTGGLTLRF